MAKRTVIILIAVFWGLMTLSTKADATECFDLDGDGTFDDCPVALWRFEEDSGNIAYDSSENHDAVMMGDTSWVDGKLGGAVSLDGDGDYLVVNDSPALNPANEITIEIWAKSGTGVWSDHGMIVSKRNAYILHPWDNSKSISFYFFHNGSPQGVQYTFPNAEDITQWHHYVATYNGTRAKIYVDGVLKADVGRSGSIDSTNQPLHIGRDLCLEADNPDCLTRFYNGEFDEAAIYDKALTAAEVLERYNMFCSNAEGDDSDGDGYCANEDSCPDIYNPEPYQSEDVDGDGVGDLCDVCPGAPDVDTDGDGTLDCLDICPGDPDDDSTDNYDGHCADEDNCPDIFNPGQEDVDGDGVGDLCDVCPGAPDVDTDGDGTLDCLDPCPLDLLDDIDGDSFCDSDDNCVVIPNCGQTDTNGDGIGDACDPCSDLDGDGVNDICPAASWRFEETVGDVFYDISGNGYHGTMEGGTLRSDGIFGGGLSFDGDQDYAVVPVASNSSPILDNSSNGVSVEVWAKSVTSQWNDYGMLVSYRNNFIMHPKYNTKSITFYVNISGYGWRGVTFTTAQDIRNWHHYAGTFDGTTIKIYEDGVIRAGSPAFSGVVNENIGDLFFGLDSGSGFSNRYFNGEIDEVAIYDFPLTALEIEGRYNLVVNPNATPPCPTQPTNTFDLIAPPDITVEATGAQSTVALGNATVTGAVGLVSITNAAPASFPVGITSFTWTATDAAGNTDTDTQTVTVVDTTAPVVAAPPDITVEATGTQTDVATGTATATDLVDGALTPASDAPSSFPLGTTIVTWSATDAAGNTGTATQTVTVEDTIAPTVTSSSSNLSGCGDWNINDVTIHLHADDLGSGVKEIRYSIDGGTGVVISGDQISFMIDDAGDHAIIYEIEDNEGNVTSGLLTVTVLSEAGALEELKAKISALPDGAFKNNTANRVKALSNKINVLITIVAAAHNEDDPAAKDALYDKAVSKLINDIQTKMNGCGESADNNDWITDCGAQSELNSLIDCILAVLTNAGNVIL